MLNLVNLDAQELLTLLKTAYYNQTGETIQIGSNEFATSAVQSYVWSVLLNNINENTRNLFIDTATGIYLDALASNYGINERPAGYHATASFKLKPWSDDMTIPANAIVVQDSSGNQFTNPYAIHIPVMLTTSYYYTYLQAVNAGSEYNGIPSGAINEVVEGGLYIDTAVSETMTAGGTDGFPYTDEGDEAYREYLKNVIKTFAGCGTYQAYEAKAKLADSRVLDVYVLKQGDEGYEKGKVHIYIYADPDTDIDNQVRQIVENACDDPAFRPVGDLVQVEYSPLEDKDISKTIQVTYPSRFKGSTNVTTILNKYKAQLSTTINKPFCFEELCRLYTEKDERGVYALDAKPLGIYSTSYPKPIYPEVGSRLNIDDITFDVNYEDER